MIEKQVKDAPKREETDRERMKRLAKDAQKAAEKKPETWEPDDIRTGVRKD